MISYNQIFENNREWVRRHTEEDIHFLDKLAGEQQPNYLYIGCSDSRVTAESIMGAAPGEVFVHRNIANLVNSVDLNVMSVIEYAVTTLRVKHIIICGHYHCGGVKAAMLARDMGILNPWLRTIRDIYRMHQAELDAIGDEGARYNRLVELNVQEQAVNVIKTAGVQLSYFENGFPIVHGWVFDLHNGLLKDLEIDFWRLLKGVRKIYDLTGGMSSENSLLTSIHSNE
jgi:carbonic anhydrase